jgi:hypothetical protein
MPNLLEGFLVDYGRIGYRTHSSGVQPCITLSDSFVIARRRHEHVIFAVSKSKD